MQQMVRFSLGLKPSLKIHFPLLPHQTFLCMYSASAWNMPAWIFRSAGKHWWQEQGPLGWFPTERLAKCLKLRNVHTRRLLPWERLKQLSAVWWTAVLNSFGRVRYKLDADVQLFSSNKQVKDVFKSEAWTAVDLIGKTGRRHLLAEISCSSLPLLKLYRTHQQYLDCYLFFLLWFHLPFFFHKLHHCWYDTFSPRIVWYFHTTQFYLFYSYHLPQCLVTTVKISLCKQVLRIWVITDTKNSNYT